MNDTTELVTTQQETAPPYSLGIQNKEGDASKDRPPPDAKALRTAHVGKLLDSAYQGASTLKLKPDESKKLREDFPDSSVEVRSFDGIVYISHMALRERLWEVFGPGSVAEICRERFMRPDTSEVAVDLVLMVRGVFVAEGVGTAKFFANNAKTSFGDVVESAWSEALRRCCKKFGVGTQVWRPAYIREWLENNTVQQGGKWIRKDASPATPARKPRKYELRGHEGALEEHPMNPANQPEKDDDGDDIPF